MIRLRLIVFKVLVVCLLIQASAQAPELVVEWQGHARMIKGLAFTSVPNRELLSGDNEGFAVYWDLLEFQESSAPLKLSGLGHYPYTPTVHGEPYAMSIAALAVNPSGTIAAIAHGSSIHLWDIAAHTRVGEFDSAEGAPGSAHLGTIADLEFYGDGHLASAAIGKWGVRLWDLSTLTDVARGPETLAGNAISVSADGLHIVSAHGGGSLRFWNPDLDYGVLEEVGRYRAAQTAVLSVAINPELPQMAAGYDNGIVAIWNLESAYDPQILIIDDSRVNALEFSPDGMWLLAGTSNGNLRIWNMIDGGAITLPRRSGRVREIAFDAQNRRFAVGTENGQLSLFAFPD